MKITKPEPVRSIDSEATEDYIDPTEPIKHKQKSRKPLKPIKTNRSRTLITRSYFLRKDGKGTSANVKPRRKHKFKCPKCTLQTTPPEITVQRLWKIFPYPWIVQTS